MATCWVDRDRLRTCTVEVDQSGNKGSPPVDNPELREQIQELLDVILTHINITEDEDVEE